jgi:ATP-dependent Clp protease ATP-binding subunit ClpC
LQILEDGLLTDAQGRKINFKNTVIIMTSNVGARLITEKHKLGFGVTDDSLSESDKRIKDDVMGELRRTFRPEFLNRVDDIIVFHQLTTGDIKKIAGRMLGIVGKRIEALGISVDFTDEVVTKISQEGFDPIYGARPLRRAIQAKIEDRLSEEMLSAKIKSGDKVVAKLENNEIDFVKAL